MAKLFYLMGPSGAGKDSLLEYARTHIDEAAPVVFAHRYITRPANAGGENHRSLSESEFALRSRNNCFAMKWCSHGLCYGVGKEIDAWLAQGLSVMVNGSRSYFSTASQKYPDITPILVDVDSHVLAGRLTKRGRESQQEIQARLSKIRSKQTIQHPNLMIIENNTTIDQAGETLLEIIYKQIHLPLPIVDTTQAKNKQLKSEATNG